MSWLIKMTDGISIFLTVSYTCGVTLLFTEYSFLYLSYAHTTLPAISVSQNNGEQESLSFCYLYALFFFIVLALPNPLMGWKKFKNCLCHEITQAFEKNFILKPNCFPSLSSWDCIFQQDTGFIKSFYY